MTGGATALAGADGEGQQEALTWRYALVRPVPLAYHSSRAPAGIRVWVARGYPEDAEREREREEAETTCFAGSPRRLFNRGRDG